MPQVRRDVSDVHFPDAAKIVLVQDNLNTHKPASFYEAFPPPTHSTNLPIRDVRSQVASLIGRSGSRVSGLTPAIPAD
jgi:hypothetical protein